MARAVRRSGTFRNCALGQPSWTASSPIHRYRFVDDYAVSRAPSPGALRAIIATPGPRACQRVVLTPRPCRTCACARRQPSLRSREQQGWAAVCWAGRTRRYSARTAVEQHTKQRSLPSAILLFLPCGTDAAYACASAAVCLCPQQRGDRARWLHADEERAAGRHALADLVEQLGALQQQLAAAG